LLRVFHDKSQTDLAKELEISKSHLSEIEANKKAPSLELLQKYAEVFQVPLSSILFFAENVDKRPNVQKLKGAVASRVLKILELIDARADAEKKERAQA
jgi:transcriptional regulator with XRE-family HTH domain